LEIFALSQETDAVAATGDVYPNATTQQIPLSELFDYYGLQSGYELEPDAPPANGSYVLDSSAVGYFSAVVDTNDNSYILGPDVDVANSRRIAGWAQNVDYPEAPVCLDIYVGDRFVGQPLANRYREDLKRAGLGSGRHSFEFIPPPGLAFAPDAIEIRRSLDGAALASSFHSRPTSSRRGQRRPLTICSASITNLGGCTRTVVGFEIRPLKKCIGHSVSDAGP
jgi:hypothetical protein